MPKLVKEVFFVLMFATIGLVVYILFMGTFTPNGTAITQAQLSTGNAMGITNVSSEGHYGWEGLISYVSRHIELPIARFYYDNCYLPTAHNTTYLDSVISGTPYAPTYASMSTLNQGSSGPTSGAHNHYMAGDSF